VNGVSRPHRKYYKHYTLITTRWKDNDVYGHINNTEYYSYFDTIINSYLIKQNVLDILHGNEIGLCIESKCQFKKPLSFPCDIDGGLSVSKIGNSSVTYEVGIFEKDQQDISAFGHFVHVFVDKKTRRPINIPMALKDSLEKIKVNQPLL